MRLYRMLVRWLVLGVNALSPAPLVPLAPNTFRWNQNPWAKRLYGRTIDSPASAVRDAVGAVLRLVVGLFTPRRLVALALLLLLITVPDLGGGGLVALGFAGETAPAAPAPAPTALTLDQQKARLAEAMKEMDATQLKYHGVAMPEDVAAQFDTLCTEIKGHQDHLDGEYLRQGRASDLKRWAGVIPEPTMPRPEPGPTSRIAGYMSLGDYVLSQKAVYEAMNEGAETVMSRQPKVNLARGIFDLVAYEGKQWVEVSRDEVKAFYEAIESKAVPTIGAGIIEPQRLPGITQVQKDLFFTVRNLLPQTTTDSDQVEYIRRSATTRAAAETAAGTTKPEAAMTFDLITSPVRTIPVHMPVQNQQLADFGQLRGEIDSFLLYDIARREEEQFIYGDGTGQNLEGIMVVTGTTDISANGRHNPTIHTLIDVIRMGMTDVLVAGWVPTAALIHPFDWETVEIEKGTDNRYVWVVVTNDNGSRMWGLPIVESHGAQASAGSATEARNIIVADWLRGAQIADRQQTTISVGTINAQFVQNVRTILAEERLAFPIRVPSAFATFETQVDVP